MGRGEFLAIAKYLAHERGDDTHRSTGSYEIFWNLEGLERFVQPGSPLFVLVAIADKSAVFVFRRHGLISPLEDLIVVHKVPNIPLLLAVFRFVNQMLVGPDSS